MSRPKETDDRQQTRKATIVGTTKNELLARIGCTSLMPMDAFIAQLAKRGLKTELRVPATDGMLAGEVIHVTGPKMNIQSLRVLVGDAKAAALRQNTRKQGPTIAAQAS